MKTFLTRKKSLLFALYEDALFLFFLFMLIASSLEILLPGMIANRLPLAFLFTLFALLVFAYIQLRKKMGLEAFRVAVPRSLLIVLFIALTLVTLFMARDFGVFGAIIQAFLMALALYYWLREK